MSNVLLDEKNAPFFIDYSRIPYGDAGIDIGWFVGYMLFSKICTENKIYLEAAQYFVDQYIAFSGDSKILDYCLMSLFWLGIIWTFPPVF